MQKSRGKIKFAGKKHERERESANAPYKLSSTSIRLPDTSVILGPLNFQFWLISIISSIFYPSRCLEGNWHSSTSQTRNKFLSPNETFSLSNPKLVG